MNTIDCSPIVFFLARCIFMTSKINTRQAFAKSLRQCREYKALTQEDFGEKSSRTYVSTLERGLKSPTLEKIDDLAGVLEVHPLVLLAMTYVDFSNKTELAASFEEICNEIISISKDT